LNDAICFHGSRKQVHSCLPGVLIQTILAAKPGFTTYVSLIEAFYTTVRYVSMNIKVHFKGCVFVVFIRFVL